MQPHDDLERRVAALEQVEAEKKEAGRSSRQSGKRERRNPVVSSTLDCCYDRFGVMVGSSQQTRKDGTVEIRKFREDGSSYFEAEDRPDSGNVVQAGMSAGWTDDGHLEVIPESKIPESKVLDAHPDMDQIAGSVLGPEGWALFGNVDPIPRRS